MEMCRLHPQTPHRLARNQAAGFSLLEVMIAIAILVIGLSAMAALVAQSISGTDRARYMGLATMLTSEKLEDLNRWSGADPHVSAGGSLTADGQDTPTSTENYFDDIDLSNTSGQVSETDSNTVGGVTTYTSVIHKATGEVIPASTTAAPTGSGIVAFHRRWLIEPNPTVNGVALTGSRRVTVVVTLSNQSIKPPVSFQMSLVRP